MNEFQYTDSTQAERDALVKARMAEKDAEYAAQRLLLEAETPKKTKAKINKPTLKQLSALAMPDEQFVEKLAGQYPASATPAVLPNGLVVGSVAELMRRPDRKSIYAKPQQSPEMLAEEALAEKNYQAVRPLPPDGSVAGLAQRGNTGMTYPSLIPDFLKAPYQRAVGDGALNIGWNSLKNYFKK